MGDELEPSQVSALLGAEPTVAKRKGDPLFEKPGSATSRTGMWRLEASPREPEDVDSQVSEILSKLTQNLEVWRQLRSTFEIDLFCGWFMTDSNEGVALSPGTLGALAERGIQLEIDIYAPRTDA